jgi:hypothetical protein
MGVPRAKLLILLAFVVRDQEAGGSNPLAPTKFFNNIHIAYGLREPPCDVTFKFSQLSFSTLGFSLTIVPLPAVPFDTLRCPLLEFGVAACLQRKPQEVSDALFQIES